jgi:DJ-1 family protein
MANALVVLAPGAEEIEFITVPDVLVRAGHQVTIAGTAELPVVRGSRGLPLVSQCRLNDVLEDEFAVVYLPGGKLSAETHRDDPRVQDLIARQLASGRLLAVICAAPIALIQGGHLNGRQITSFPGVRAEVEPHCTTWLDQPVVIDGNLITSQGAGTTLALALALVTRLDGGEHARAVARQMIAVSP